MRDVVELPQRTPPTTGLVPALRALGWVFDDTAPRWVDEGVEFSAEDCPGWTGYNANAACNGQTVPLEDIYTTHNIFEASPWTLVSSYNCSTLGRFARDDYEERARRALDENRSYLVANELLFGSGREFSGDDVHELGPMLTAVGDDTEHGPTLTAASGGDLVTVFADMDGLLTLANRNGRGLLLVTPHTLEELAGQGLIAPAGAFHVSANGNAVVADAGFEGVSIGEDAEAGLHWIAGVSRLFLRLGPVDVLGGLRASDVRTTNDVQAVALQPALLYSDLCFWSVALYTQCGCSGGGGGGVDGGGA